LGHSAWGSGIPGMESLDDNCSVHRRSSHQLSKANDLLNGQRASIKCWLDAVDGASHLNNSFASLNEAASRL